MKKLMEKEYALWLSNLPGIGNVRGSKLLSLCEGSYERLYHASETIWKQVISDNLYEQVKTFTEEWKLQEEYERLLNKGIGFVLLSEEEYPVKLKQIPDAPLALFYKGKLTEKEPLTVAVIGARDSSEYGKYVAREVGDYLGGQGIPLVSGMARGIDGISQTAALDAGGSSYGVLGCGVDVCYPAANRELYQRLTENGAVISSYPPGTEPRPQNFPPRNRIVSGLADVVLVIEARGKSGTLITVDMALEQGKEVYVVPGRVTDRLSDGCNRLLKQGAQIFLSPEEFVEECLGSCAERNAWNKKYREKRNSKQSKSCTEKSWQKKGGDGLSEALKQLYEVLDFTAQSVGEIQKKLPQNYSISELSTMLMMLCMKKKAVQVGSGYFSVVR